MHALNLLIPHDINCLLGALEVKLKLPIFLAQFEALAFLYPGEEILVLRDLSLGVAIPGSEIPAAVLLPKPTRGREVAYRIGAAVNRCGLLFALAGHLVEQPERRVLGRPLRQARPEHREFLLVFLLQLRLDALILDQLCLLLLLLGSAHVPIQPRQAHLLPVKLPLEVLNVLLVEYDFLDFFLGEEEVRCVIQAVRVDRLLAPLGGRDLLLHGQVV